MVRQQRSPPKHLKNLVIYRKPPNNSGWSNTWQRYIHQGPADMEVMLQVLEERIISKLSAQFSVHRALLEQHDTTIHQLETSMNNMQSRALELETTCSMLMKENKRLTLKSDDLENRSCHWLTGEGRGSSPLCLYLRMSGKTLWTRGISHTANSGQGSSHRRPQPGPGSASFHCKNTSLPK